MKTSLFSYFIFNRLLIVTLGLFSTVLVAHLGVKNLHGDRSIWHFYQGDHTYIYIQPDHPLISIWAVWDTKRYISIAEDGYSTQPYPYLLEDNKGFLPMYPMLMYLFGQTLFWGNTHVAGIVLSNIFLLLALYYLVKLIRSEPKLNNMIKEKEVVLYTLLFPTSYYLSAIYPESMLLLLSILVFYCVKKEKIFLACLFFAIACLTKTFGIFLCIPIAFYMFQQRAKISLARLLLYVATLLTLPILYCLHMYNVSGDALAYIHMQQTHFRHVWAEPFTVIIKNIMSMNAYSLWTSSFIIFGLVALGAACRKIPIAYTLFGLMYILFTPLTGVIEGSSRYIASLFVIPIALAACVKHEDLRNMIYILFATVQGFAIFWWVAGAGFTS